MDQNVTLNYSTTMREGQMRCGLRELGEPCEFDLFRGSLEVEGILAGEETKEMLALCRHQPGNGESGDRRTPSS